MDEKLTTKPLVVMPPILLAVLAVFLSLAWLIPNHTRPWAAFYSDAIVGTVLLVVSLWVLIRSPGKVELIGSGGFFLALAIVPWLQFALGIVYSSGMAWINSFYLIGFSLAIFTGCNWEKSTPGQCLDFLFLAILLAAILLVGMQVMQWFQLTSGNFWVAGGGKSRFFGNMGQPNQLASLLLLAVLGGAWGYARKVILSSFAFILVLYLLFGVALTESRTAWLNIIGILGGLWLFWGNTRPKYFNFALLGFGAYFIALYFSLPVINGWLFGEMTIPREAADPIRVEVWGKLAKAAIERPWLGYGWGQTDAAVFASSDFPATGATFRHAHNLVLDLILYNGVLLGGLVIVVLAWTFRRFLAYLKHEQFIIPSLAVGLLLVHAMLELPLHYGYFLLPSGMILGVLGQRSGAKVWCACPKSIALAVAGAVAFGLWITIADCLEAERTYFNVYFGKQGKSIPPEHQPKLTMLTQWRDRLIFANSAPGEPLPPEKLIWMKGVVVTTPEPYLLMLLAKNLALNGRPDEAKVWLENMCKMTSETLNEGLAKEWEKAEENNVAFRMVAWSHCQASESIKR